MAVHIRHEGKSMCGGSGKTVDMVEASDCLNCRRMWKEMREERAELNRPAACTFDIGVACARVFDRDLACLPESASVRVSQGTVSWRGPLPKRKRAAV